MTLCGGLHECLIIPFEGPIFVGSLQAFASDYHCWKA